MNLPLLITIFIIFSLIIISYMIESLDFVAISLLGCFIAATITGINQGLQIPTFISFIEWEAIIIILSMSIITKIAQDSNVLEYVAVKMFKISKGNQRIFFYLLCILSTLLASIISDVVVVLILAPVVIRLCHFLKIRAGTYLLGMTICINIGSIITPFSSGENIIISTYFNLGTDYFFQYYWLFAFSLLFLTAFILDTKMLSKEPKIKVQQKSFVLELVDADVLIKNKFMFYLNSIAIIVTVILFAILPNLYLTAAISALILVLVNQQYTKNKMSDILRDVEWEIIFFFISLYVVVGCLLEAGFQEVISAFPFADFNIFILSLIILISVSFLSGAVANTPTALIFIPIVGTLIDLGFSPIPLLFAFIIGINLGGNFLPQGAACDMMTLKIAQDRGVENFEKKRLIKYGGIYALFHILVSIGYLLLLVFIFG
ncbi:MAG: SLC13 family permease [Promethearchaeia archaeon]